jgi:hypothetical protein
MASAEWNGAAGSGWAQEGIAAYILPFWSHEVRVE